MSLFDDIDWIKKNTYQKPESDSTGNAYMLNRWLSMDNLGFAHTVNLTGNRWIKNPNIKYDFYVSFYRNLLPKSRRRINYLKKKEKTKKQPVNQGDSIDIREIANGMELSIREVSGMVDFLQKLDLTKKTTE